MALKLMQVCLSAGRRETDVVCDPERWSPAETLSNYIVLLHALLSSPFLLHGQYGGAHSEWRALEQASSGSAVARARDWTTRFANVKPSLFLWKDFASLPADSVTRVPGDFELKAPVRGKLNLNSATALQLSKLGVPPEMADKVVKYRGERGLVTDIEALRKAAVMHPGTIRHIEPGICFSELQSDEKERSVQRPDAQLAAGSTKASRHATSKAQSSPPA